jgi:phage terminase small subunit
MAGNRNSGRRPTPTNVLKMRGNPGKRPLNDAEPKPPDGPVVKPGHLSAAAGMAWDELAPIAEAMSTLTSADVAAFGTMCELEASRRAESAKKDLAPADFSAQKEVQIAAALRAYYEKFGLEPSGRARIRVSKNEAPASKWAGLIG